MPGRHTTETLHTMDTDGMTSTGHGGGMTESAQTGAAVTTRVVLDS